MKIAVIGGGGVRSMFLARSLAARAKEFDFSEIVFMDNDERKLSIFGAMAREIALRICPSVNFRLTTSPEDALSGADYVITTIRAGGDLLRVREERAALDLGLLGQETTGASGFSFAMRSIPALQGYCELAKKISSPHVKIFNFTNPAGLVSQALRDCGYDFTFGICDAPSGMLRAFADFLGVPPASVQADCYGANHLSFFSSLRVDGKEVLPRIISDDEAYRQTDLRYFAKEHVLRLGTIPNEYLYYYYDTERAIRNILAAGETRGEVIARVNERMQAELAPLSVERDFAEMLKIFEKWHSVRENAYMANETGVRREKPWHFDPFGKDDGGYAGVALRYIELAGSKEGGEMILCVPNNGAMDFLPDNDVVEVTCTVRDGVCTPKPVTAPNPENKALILAVKKYERLAARAILERDAGLAVQALAVHPLVANEEKAELLVKAFVKVNGTLAGEWKL